MVHIDISTLFSDKAKLDDLPEYERKVITMVPDGQEVLLTGRGPVWVYLRIAHALHGKAKKLVYRSPVTGDVVIFDHDPY